MIDAKYLKDLRTLETLYKTAMKLSLITTGREVNTWRESYGSHIFSKICLTGIAILKLLPKRAFNMAPVDLEIWDISSVCILARSLIDTYNVFHYLIIEKVDKDELEFRFVLWNLHDVSERIKGLELMKSKRSEMNNLKQNLQNLREKLKNNNFYQKIDSKKQKDFIKGDKGIFLTNAKISENAGINPNYYRVAYKYLSQYVHTYPFSISQMAKFRAVDSESLALLHGVVGYCTGYLSVSIRDFLKVFPDQSMNIPHSIIEIIKEWEFIMKNIFTVPSGATPDGE